MDTNCRVRNTNGFTLIELLVALAIVALTAAILFPVFAGVRERGRRTTCQSNLKQIALAMQQYVQDNNGTYPSIPFRWTDATYPYLKNADVFCCPDHPAEMITDQLGNIPQLASGTYPVDYTYNMARLSVPMPPYPTKTILGCMKSTFLLLRRFGST